MEQHNGKKLVTAAISVILAVVVLTTASFAWFTLSTNPETSGMTFMVGGSEDLLLSTDAEHFDYTVDISKEFDINMNTLRPVSTINGLDWFVCDYDIGTGNVVQDEFYQKHWCINENHFNPDDVGELIHNPGTDSIDQCNNGGFFAYTDVWIKSESDETVAVRLSTPINEALAIEEEFASGSYVLSYDLIPTLDEEGKAESYVVKLIEGGPETCVRIGMMVFDPTIEGQDDPIRIKANQDTKDGLGKGIKQDTATGTSPHFFIYEPNADVRSQLDKQAEDYFTDIYVSGLEIKKEGFTDVLDYDQSRGKYIQTYPIKYMGEIPEPPVEDEDKTEEGQPTVEGTAETTEKELPIEALGTLVKAAPAVFPADHLLVQSNSSWKKEAIYEAAGQNTHFSFADAVEKLLKLRDGKDPLDIIDVLMTNDYVTRGKFVTKDDVVGTLYGKVVNTGTAVAPAWSPAAAEGQHLDLTGNKGNTYYRPWRITAVTTKDEEGNVTPTISADVAYGQEANATSQPLFTLSEGQIRQIRLFFWIEGQDVDCWNDVSGMNFLARLEFAGSPVTDTDSVVLETPTEEAGEGEGENP